MIFQICSAEQIDHHAHQSGVVHLWHRRKSATLMHQQNIKEASGEVWREVVYLRRIISSLSQLPPPAGWRPLWDI